MRAYILIILATTSAACCIAASPPRSVCPKPPTVEAEIDAKAAPEVRLDSMIDETSAKKVIEELDEAAKAKPRRIVLRINTPGGNFEDAQEIVRRMEAIEVETPVHCVVDGDALSAGFYILQACSRRTMTARSRLMAHEPYFPVLTTVTLDDLVSYTTRLRATRSAYSAQCAARLSISRAAFDEKIRGHDWYLDADVALEAGAVDAVQALKR